MRRVVTALAAIPLILACSETTEAPTSGLQLSFSAYAPANGLAQSAGTQGTVLQPVADTIRDGTNTLVINQAELVLREIELEHSGTTICMSGTVGCEDIELGPVLVTLPLEGAVQALLIVQVPV